jgi:hypothetical protein
MFGGWCGVSQTGAEYGLLYGISRRRRMRRLEAFLYLAAQNFTLLKNLKSKLKSFKNKAVNILSWAYPMILLSGRSNLAGRYQ